MSALVDRGDLSASIRLLNPQTTAEWAAVYAAEMREMRRMLQVGFVGRLASPFCPMVRSLPREGARSQPAMARLPCHTNKASLPLPTHAQECDVELPPERFDSTNAELFRFAKACGLMAVSSAGAAD